MTDFKEDKSTISELRGLIGKPCKRRTLRGWIHAGIIEAVELRDNEVFVTVNSGVRGARDQKFSMRNCKIEEIKEGDTASERLAAKVARWRTMKEQKEQKKKDAEDKAKKIADRFKLIQRLKGQSTNSEE